nr:DUF3309 family protein [Candidatus Protochlamydia phocaeensis]
MLTSEYGYSSLMKIDKIFIDIFFKGEAMLGTVLIVIIILLLIGAFPSWPHSSGWGYGPSGLLGTILIIVLILWLLGRL